MAGGKVKVLMIHPEISRTKYNFAGVIVNECLELEYLSAILKEKGHEAVLYDVQVENGRIPAVLRRVKPDVVYVCGRTRQENFMLEYCRNAKEYHAGIITIIGGVHAQLCYERMYSDSVDYILTTFDSFKVLDTFLEYQDRMITGNPSHFDYLHLVAEPRHLSVRRYYLY